MHEPAGIRGLVVVDETEGIGVARQRLPHRAVPRHRNAHFRLDDVAQAGNSLLPRRHHFTGRRLRVVVHNQQHHLAAGRPFDPSKGLEKVRKLTWPLEGEHCHDDRGDGVAVPSSWPFADDAQQGGFLWHSIAPAR